MSQREAAAWRQIAERMDASGEKRLYAPWIKEYPAALDRLSSYDNANPLWDYGPDDHYMNMDSADAVLAALWLALDAEDEAR